MGRFTIVSVNRHPRIVVAVVVGVAGILFCFNPSSSRFAIRQKEFVSHQSTHTIERQLVADHREKASAIMVCLIMTASSSNVSLDRIVRTLDHAYIPTTVALHLAVVSSTPIAIRKDAWHRGNCTVFRNVSLVRFRQGLCFIVIQDTVDIGPYFVYWMWRVWNSAGNHPRGLLIAGDARGTAGVIPHHELWVRFVRSERALGNKDAMTRYFIFVCRTDANASILHAPTLDGYVVARAERQSMVNPEREPRLIRVWDERFVTRAVFVLRVNPPSPDTESRTGCR